MKFRKKGHEEIWADFANGDFETIESDNYQSIAETILVERSKTRLWPKYASIKGDMRSIFREVDSKPYFVDKKDDSHMKRILYYIDGLLFDRNSLNEPREATLDMSPEQLFVLLCAVQLHDYGKVRWQLTRYSLLKDVADQLEKDKSLFGQICTSGDNLRDISEKLDEIRTKSPDAEVQKRISAAELLPRLGANTINDLPLST